MISNIYNAIIFSIKSIHAEKIYSGDKKFELRKVAPKIVPQIAFIYETENVKAITGAFFIKNIVSSTINDLWNIVGTRATSKNSFHKYYKNYKEGVAYEIGRIYKFDHPLTLAQIFDIQSDFKIPQSFAYLKNYPILEHILYERIDILNTKPLSFSIPTNQDLILFKDLALKEISKNYDEIDDTFANAIIKSAKLWHDPHGYFTSNKQIISVKYESQTIGFTVLTYKITDAIKTGPTLLLETYRGKGFGLKIRNWIENFAINKGFRKLYCTCNAYDNSVVKYLLKSGMHIEAHLMNQYKIGSSEFVFGKLIVGGNSKKYPLFFRTDLEQSAFVIYNDSDYDNMQKFLLNNFKKSYLSITETFVKKLNQSTINFKIDKYSSKGKIIFYYHMLTEKRRCNQIESYLSDI